jgi:hypothetical protein
MGFSENKLLQMGLSKKERKTPNSSGSSFSQAQNAIPGVNLPIFHCHLHVP